MAGGVEALRPLDAGDVNERVDLSGCAGSPFAFSSVFRVMAFPADSRLLPGGLAANGS